MENINKHDLPLIRKERLADNIEHRMDLYGSIQSINKYDAIVNVMAEWLVWVQALISDYYLQV